MLGQLGNGGFAKHAREVSRPPSATWTLPDFVMMAIRASMSTQAKQERILQRWRAPRASNSLITGTVLSSVIVVTALALQPLMGSIFAIQSVECIVPGVNITDPFIPGFNFTDTAFITAAQFLQAKSLYNISFSKLTNEIWAVGGFDIPTSFAGGNGSLQLVPSPSIPVNASLISFRHDANWVSHRVDQLQLNLSTGLVETRGRAFEEVSRASCGSSATTVIGVLRQFDDKVRWW
ncbi:hypothetical protein M422DRAFT_259261 [Sphaerobolus stellatus SS14]|uniref:Uncharacterized protein n=1 Tax=Sphaerobolus stellatus (strain SS14) TaxID=990650 RepID=A0A0C9U554_SPHS4|nr:hypothetical protein M422DRAFT_259261 [Sphaerobolus stellatus SS14]